MSNFSRKHYIRVAAIIKKAWDSAKGHPAAIDAITCLEWDFIEMFREDNPRFDTSRFHRACCGEEE